MCRNRGGWLHTVAQASLTGPVGQIGNDVMGKSARRSATPLSADARGRGVSSIPFGSATRPVVASDQLPNPGGSRNGTNRKIWDFPYVGARRSYPNDELRERMTPVVSCWQE